MKKNILAIAALCFAIGSVAFAAEGEPASAWLSGDFHQHTYFTDGSTTFDFVMGQNVVYGLDWWANSEHGGERNRDGNGNFWDDPNFYAVNPILGAYEVSGGHQEMWRWQSLRDFAYPGIEVWRGLQPEKRIFSGLEWNVPGHEHCSTGIVAPDASALSAFEYQFDNSDDDFSRDGEATPFGVLSKQNGKFGFTQGANGVSATSKTYPERHTDSVAGCAWMQQQYDNKLIENGWIVWAHVERAGAWSPTRGGGYNVEHFRDFNNAGPDVCFGFEGAPGHQTNPRRGLGNLQFGGTYGGVGFYTAQVGGLWDALLGEGRRFFNFASSDYHRHHTNGGDDFYPGEYQRTWVKAIDEDGDSQFSLNEIANAMRAGRAYFVHGDLVNYLDMTLRANGEKVDMGGELTVKPGDALALEIRFRSPATNFNGDVPAVDHIDLIKGDVTGIIEPTDARYTDPTNPSAQVVWQFFSNQWRVEEDGTRVISYAIKVPRNAQSFYLRIRGTNHANCTPFETDCQGNPIADDLATKNLGLDEAEEAWADLWFYGNPIFVNVVK